MAEGQSDIFLVLVTRNRFWLYSSMVRLPSTQLFPSRLVMLVKPVVSARAAVGGAVLVEDCLGVGDWLIFWH